jgi:hypothetical protein
MKKINLVCNSEEGHKKKQASLCSDNVDGGRDGMAER